LIALFVSHLPLEQKSAHVIASRGDLLRMLVPDPASMGAAS
jgi:hypothetical protein